jgi:anti-sigma regulatory factor (Ser/Thr protein kinase)
MATTASPHVEVSFAPTIRLITVMRQFVSSFYAAVLGRDAAEMLAMATHELLENALKYSAEEGATFKIAVESGAETDHVTIRIENHADPAQIQPLREVMARMEQAADPMAHYLTLMRETSSRLDGSGLGLARLRAEAEMKVALEVDGTRVCVVAQSEVRKERKETS